MVSDTKQCIQKVMSIPLSSYVEMLVGRGVLMLELSSQVHPERLGHLLLPVLPLKVILFA